MDGIERRDGHYLPHWTADEAIYFVTFRLADSLPNTVIAEFEEEYRHGLRVEEVALKRKLNSDELRKANARLRTKIEKWLDSGHGDCHMKIAACAEIEERSRILR